MARKGERWIPELTDISDAVYASKGNITATCKKLNIHKCTFYEYMNDHPEVSEIVEKAREYQSIDEVDLAVQLNMYFMQNYKINPALASKHTMFTLDRKGRSRGYLRLESSDDDMQKITLSEVKEELKNNEICQE